jgi:sec-independent protein translocase protein TatA
MNLLFANLFSPAAVALLLFMGVLLFGRRLPEIGRSVGVTIKEFKKGIQGLEDDVEPMTASAHRVSESPAAQIPQRMSSAGLRVDG